MTRKLKALGMALVAVLALTAVAASAALAEGNYTTSSYPTTATGESPHGNGTFTTEAGSTECKTHVEATLVEASSQLTAQAKVTECRAFGFLSATVNMGSCDYLFTTATKTGVDAWRAPVDIVCTNSAQPITITAGTCEVTIGAQGAGGGVNIVNNTAAGDVSIQLAVTGIGYTVTKDGFGCPFGGTGAKTGATATHHNPITFDSTNGATIDVG